MTPVQRSIRWLWGLLLLLFIPILGSAPLAEGAALSHASFAHGRMGFGWNLNYISTTLEMVKYLNAGWYWDWIASGASSFSQVEYAQTISFRPVFEGGVQVGYTIWQTKATLLQIIAAHPGALWLIGNEPDCHAMDNMVSDWYARAYHDVYHLGVFHLS